MQHLLFDVQITSPIELIHLIHSLRISVFLYYLSNFFKIHIIFSAPLHVFSQVLSHECAGLLHRFPHRLWRHFSLVPHPTRRKGQYGCLHERTTDFMVLLPIVTRQKVFICHERPNKGKCVLGFVLWTSLYVLTYYICGILPVTPAGVLADSTHTTEPGDVWELGFIRKTGRHLLGGQVSRLPKDRAKAGKHVHNPIRFVLEIRQWHMHECII